MADDTRLEEESCSSIKGGKKVKERGLIYLSRIPTNMTVKKIRHMFSQYGDIDRIYLQPDEKVSQKQRNRVFTEGWIEFLDKRIAKKVALSLNNAQIGGKRRSKFYDELWNIKYLSRFKWTHLNERLAYEREVHKQRMRTEVTLAKKQTAHYLNNVEKAKAQERRVKKLGQEEALKNQRDWSFSQRETESQKLAKNVDKKSLNRTDKRKAKKPDSRNVGTDKSFLKSIFSVGIKDS